MYAFCAMKISLNWLGDFVEWIEKDPQEIARQITAHTAEVDEVIVEGGILTHCCVGKVLTVSKHPDADRLSLCDVDTDRGKKKVVCGGSNLRDGMCVAFAHIGAQVKWHGEELMTLEKTKIRGETSEGMICAAEELDLTVQFPEAVGHQIIDLGDGDDSVGKSLREHLNLNDVTLDIDNHAITQRPDLFSHVGFARECVAMGIAKWKPFGSTQDKKGPVFTSPKFATDALPIKIKNDAGKLIPRYLACTLEIDGMGETPEWMVRKLEATGWRSLNLPVDITNYVTMELGMPLHSFDLDDIQGDISMRTAKKGEKITTLDDAERELPEGAIVLSDKKGIFDLLGIMGGLRSSTKEGTRKILLHSAIVDPVSIRSTIIATGHRTDAATVYEKGIPPVTAEQGFYRAIELFLDLVPGAKITSKMDSWGDNGKANAITFDTERVTQVLGTEVSSKQISSSLKALGFDVKEKSGKLTFVPPLWRKDIIGEHDVIEEIGRMYGFDEIKPVMPAANITPPERNQSVNIIRDILKEEGYLELIPLSLLGPALLKKCNISTDGLAEIDNPIGEELSLVQPSVLPGLLEHAEEYLRHTKNGIKTFRVSNVFTKEGEYTELGLLVVSKQNGNLNEDPFLMAKADPFEALAAAGYEVWIAGAKKIPEYAHPGKTADLTIDQKKIGQLFEIHPDVRARFGITSRASAAIINIDALMSHKCSVTISKPVPQFPGVTYDITIPFSHEKSVGDLLEKIRGTSELLENVEVAKLYAPDGGKDYNLTLRCTYRASDRTLKEKEAKQAHEAVVALV